MLKFIIMILNSVFSATNIYGIILYLHNGSKLFTKLSIGLIHLRKQKFRHNYLDTINLICSWNLEIESTFHFFLRFQIFITPRTSSWMNFLNQDETLLAIFAKRTILYVWQGSENASAFLIFHIYHLLPSF